VLPPITVARGDDADVATEALRATMERALHAAQDRYPVRPKGAEDAWWLPARLGGAAPTPEEAERIAERRAVERAERKEAEEARTQAKAAARSARKGGRTP